MRLQYFGAPSLFLTSKYYMQLYYLQCVKLPPIYSALEDITHFLEEKKNMNVGE